MKSIKYFLLLLIIISCKHGSKNDENLNKSLNYIRIQEIIKECETKSALESCDLNSIQHQILNYKSLGLISIPVTEKIIRRCYATLNAAEKEKVFTAFMKNFNLVINEFNDNFEENYAVVLEKINNDVKDAESRDFKKCLNLCGLTLLSTEGMYYVDAKHDYIYNLFKKDVSPALREFLGIRSEELRQGFSDDAVLMISFDDLYFRVTNWEDFMLKYPDFFMKEEAKNYYEGYLSTLISGMDNSRIFDYEDDKLLPEIKTLYERIIANNEDRKSTRIIAAYYEYLKSIDFKYNESIEKFLKDNELFTMLGVQPDTR